MTQSTIYSNLYLVILRSVWYSFALALYVAFTGSSFVNIGMRSFATQRSVICNGLVKHCFVGLCVSLRLLYEVHEWPCVLGLMGNLYKRTAPQAFVVVVWKAEPINFRSIAICT